MAINSVSATTATVDTTSKKSKTKTVQFKCPKCSYEWSITVSSSASVSARQRCPKCKRYSDNCEKPLNAWEALAEKLKKNSKGGN